MKKFKTSKIRRETKTIINTQINQGNNNNNNNSNNNSNKFKRNV